MTCHDLLCHYLPQVCFEMLKRAVQQESGLQGYVLSKSLQGMGELVFQDLGVLARRGLWPRATTLNMLESAANVAEQLPIVLVQSENGLVQAVEAANAGEPPPPPAVAFAAALAAAAAAPLMIAADAPAAGAAGAAAPPPDAQAIAQAVAAAQAGAVAGAIAHGENRREIVSRLRRLHDELSRQKDWHPCT